MPKNFQSMQCIFGIYPPLFVGESKTVVQIVREPGKQLSIRVDGSGPILDRGIVLTINQQTILRSQVSVERAGAPDFCASLQRVAQMTPCIGRSGVRERVVWVGGDGFRQQIARVSVLERP